MSAAVKAVATSSLFWPGAGGDVGRLGGKAASLVRLAEVGVVPPWFAIPADAFVASAEITAVVTRLGTGASGTYASVTAKYNLPFLEGLSVSGEFGHYWLGTTNLAIWSTVPPTNLPDYAYWNAGVSYTWKNLTADVRYHDTNLNKTQCSAITGPSNGVSGGVSKYCNAAFVATLSFSLQAKDIK